MKNNFRLWILMLVFSFCLNPTYLTAEQELLFPNPEATISMDFQDARLKDILKIFSIQSGLNFIASEAVQERLITLYLDKVPIKEAMDKLFKANNLTYELERGSNIFIAKDWGKPQIETVTKIFYLKHATVSSSSLKEEMAQISSSTGAGTSAGASGGSGKWQIEEDSGITKAIKKLLSEFGSVIEDFRTNSLIVTDIPSRMPIITQTIAALDVPQSQVMLEVEMLDVSKTALEKMGLKFGDISSYPSIFTLTLTGAMRTTQFPFSAWTGGDYTGTSGGAITAGSVDTSTPYQALLQFIKTQTDTRYLARPRLLTLNNETAEIKITTQETIGEQLTYDDQGNLITRTAERTETGVHLRVTPQINVETSEITMFINPKVIEATTSAFSSSYRDPEERGTKSTVKIKDGETVIIGGLIRNDFSETITKLPILGDIPIVGSLFRHKNRDKNRERELLVFITPHIIKDANIELAQARKAVPLPEREQNTVSGIDRQAVVDSSLNNFEKKRK